MMMIGLVLVIALVLVAVLRVRILIMVALLIVTIVPPTTRGQRVRVRLLHDGFVGQILAQPSFQQVLLLQSRRQAIYVEGKTVKWGVSDALLTGRRFVAMFVVISGARLRAASVAIPIGADEIAATHRFLVAEVGVAGCDSRL